MDSHLLSKPVNNYIYVQDEQGQRVEGMPTGDEAPDGSLQPDNLVGRVSIIGRIATLDDETQGKIHTHLLCEVPDHETVKKADYHNLVKQLEKHSFKRNHQNFFCLVSDTVHQGPLMPQDPKHMGTAWNTFINWED